MKLLSLGVCLRTAVASGVVFFIANGIASSTVSVGGPIWTRDCMVWTDPGSDTSTTKCGKYAESWQIDHATALAGMEQAHVICTAHQTRGMFSKTELECHAP